MKKLGRLILAVMLGFALSATPTLSEAKSKSKTSHSKQSKNKKSSKKKGKSSHKNVSKHSLKRKTASYETQGKPKLKIHKRKTKVKRISF